MPHAKTEHTLQKIKSAFISLINEKGFFSLTVSDITQTAKINRGTFYLHYIDKFDLLEKTESSVIHSLEEILDTGYNNTLHSSEPIRRLFSVDVLISVAAFFHSERDLICALLNDNSTAAFLNKMKQCFQQYVIRFSKELEEQGILKNPTGIPEIYVQTVIVNHAVSIFQCWLLQKQPETPEEIALMISRTRFLSPFDLLLHTQTEEAQTLG